MPAVQLAPKHTKQLKSWTTLAQSAVAVSHTGNTTETVLATIPIAAGSMGPNGILSFLSVWSFTGSANVKTLRARLGGLSGTQIQNVAVSAATSVTFRDMRIIQNRNAENSQLIGFPPTTAEGLGAGTAAVTTAAVDTSAAQDLVFTAQLATGSESITLEAYSVERFYGA